MLKHLICCFAVCLSLSLTFMSCNDDEDPDTQKPVVNLEITRNGTVVDPSGPVRGTVTLKVNATDNLKIAHIQLFVDGQLADEQNDADLLETTFDTRTLPESPHTIKVVASDAAGNTTENSVDVTVQNVLFRYTYPKNEDMESWLVLSDNTGLVVDYKRNEGKAITFLYPQEYTDQTFDLTILTKGGDYRYYKTVTQVPPGEYVLTNDTKPTVGVYTLNVPSPQDYIFRFHGSPDAASGGITVTNNGTKYEFPLTKAASSLYLYVKEISSGESRYYYSPIQTGGSTTLDGTLWTAMKPLTTHEIPGFSNYHYTFLIGHLPDGGSILCSATESNSTSVLVDYPKELVGSVFTSFITAVSSKSVVGDFQVINSNTKKTTGMLAEIKDYEINLVSLTKTQYPQLQLTASGTANYASCRISGEMDAGRIVSWEIFGPFSSGIKVQFPVLTNEVMSAMGLPSLPVFHFLSADFYESPTLSDYSSTADYLMTRFPDEYYYDLKQKSFTPREIVGGRLGRKQMVGQQFNHHGKKFVFPGTR